MHDYLATQDLDNELGFGWPSSVNYSQLYNSEHPDSQLPYSSSRTANPYAPGQFNRATSARGEAARQGQARLFTPPQGAAPVQGGYAKPNFNNYLNPAAISSIYASQKSSAYPGVNVQRPGNGYSASPRDTGDYSTKGRNQSDLLPQTDLQKYGGYYSGGKFNAYGPPNAQMDYLG